MTMVIKRVRLWVMVLAGAAVLSVGGLAQPAAQLLVVVKGFDVPESARYDPSRDAYYVSNVTGHPTDRDDAGFISLMDPDGRITTLRWIDGRSSGITLHAPKGLAIVGDQLWAADITIVRRFDRQSGSALGEIDLAPLGATFLNDLATGPDGAVFVSDTGFVFSDGRMALSGGQRIYQIDRSGRASVLLEDKRMDAPNGVFFDAPNQRLLIASFNGPNVWAWTRTEGLQVAARGPGGYDGIEALADGRILVSSQDGASILVLRDGTLTPLITGVADVGDLGVDLKRDRVAIPRLDTNLLELWQVNR
jgi:sugar lactone lactonase YvrE